MIEKCDFCGDVSPTLFLYSRCHPTAPLRVTKVGRRLIVNCYLPECDRLVGEFILADALGAAAPDLLAACKEALESTPSGGLQTMLRAAIAKAEAAR